MVATALKCAVVAIAFAATWTSLPGGGHCDSSYYEKYYSGRRVLPPKKSTTLLACNFTVHVLDEQLRDYEQMALVGNVKALGAWLPGRAVLLNRTAVHNVWTGTVELPPNATVEYRYFVASIDGQLPAIQVLRWEDALAGRVFATTTLPENRTDRFGWIDAHTRRTQPGWLASGRLVQLQLFRNAVRLAESRGANERIFVRVQPVEREMLTPILPSAQANAQFVRMEYGNSYVAEQPEFGVPYEGDDIVIFHVAVSEMADVAYLLKVYHSRRGSNLVRPIGYQYIHADMLAGSCGNISVQLTSPVWLNTIGSVQLRYLVIAPLAGGGVVDLRTSLVDYWPPQWTGLDVGHRGLGKSLQLSRQAAPAIIENTLAAMQAAADLGADMVEFDVMLTKDLVPIIYHDYVIYVCIESKTPTSREDLTEMQIKDMTHEQLKNLKTYQMVGQKIIEYPAPITVEQEEYRLFPTLEDMLVKVARTVGFDIEIKWPQMLRSGSVEAEQTIDKNVYVDRIVSVVLQHGCGRLTFFSSFDADICTLVRYKQNMYPAMLLFDSKEGTYDDPRSDSITQAVNQAQAFNLAGIIPHASFVQKDAAWIDVARNQSKAIFLWGDSIKDVDSILALKATGPTGLIYDRLDLLLPSGKRSVFDPSAEEVQQLQLQCPPMLGGADHNATIDSILSNVNTFL